MSKKIIIEKEKTQSNYISENSEIIKNKLLGIYDSNGKYFISEKIVNELKKLPKFKKTVYENSLFCVNKFQNFGEISFEIVYEKNTDDNLAVAKLYLLEFVKKINGYVINTIKTFLDEYKNVLRNFMENSYDFFNIVVDDEGRENNIAKDVFEASYVIVKRQFLTALDSLTDEKYEDVFKNLYMQRMAILNNINSNYSKEVINEYNNNFNLIKPFFLKEKNYKDLNDLLDNSFEMINGTKEEYKKDEKLYKKEMIAVLDELKIEVDKFVKPAKTTAVSSFSNADKIKIVEIEQSEKSTSKFVQQNADFKKHTIIKEEVEDQLEEDEKKSDLKSMQIEDEEEKYINEQLKELEIKNIEDIEKEITIQDEKESVTQNEKQEIDKDEKESVTQNEKQKIDKDEKESVTQNEKQIISRKLRANDIQKIKNNENQKIKQSESIIEKLNTKNKEVDKNINAETRKKETLSIDKSSNVVKSNSEKFKDYINSKTQNEKSSKTNVSSLNLNNEHASLPKQYPLINEYLNNDANKKLNHSYEEGDLNINYEIDNFKNEYEINQQEEGVIKSSNLTKSTIDNSTMQTLKEPDLSEETIITVTLEQDALNSNEAELLDSIEDDKIDTVEFENEDVQVDVSGFFDMDKMG